MITHLVEKVPVEKSGLQVLLEALAVALEEIGEGEMLYVPDNMEGRDVTVRRAIGGYSVWLEPKDG